MVFGQFAQVGQASAELHLQRVVGGHPAHAEQEHIIETEIRAGESEGTRDCGRGVGSAAQPLSRVGTNPCASGNRAINLSGERRKRCCITARYPTGRKAGERAIHCRQGVSDV